MNKLWVAAISLLLLGCSPNEEQSLGDIRGDESIASKCYQTKDGKRIYNTAAKFSLAVPSWALNLPAENKFKANCEITSIKLHFAYIDGNVIPIPHPGLKHPDRSTLPELYDKLSFYLTFSDPEQENLTNNKDSCAHKNPTYEYPEFGFRMCPYVSTTENQNIDTLPFYPRFEIIDEKTNPTSFSCNHEDLNGYTVENIYEMDVPYTCRGYWHWRKGASAMFDISQGQILKKTYKAVSAAETLLNSWVINGN